MIGQIIVQRMKKFLMCTVSSIFIYPSMNINSNRSHYIHTIYPHCNMWSMFTIISRVEGRPVTTLMPINLGKRKPDEEAGIQRYAN
jgi:hypothetical protein